MARKSKRIGPLVAYPPRHLRDDGTNFQAVVLYDQHEKNEMRWQTQIVNTVEGSLQANALLSYALTGQGFKNSKFLRSVGFFVGAWFALPILFVAFFSLFSKQPFNWLGVLANGWILGVITLFGLVVMYRALRGGRP